MKLEVLRFTIHEGHPNIILYSGSYRTPRAGVYAYYSVLNFENPFGTEGTHIVCPRDHLHVSYKSKSMDIHHNSMSISEVWY